MDQEQVVKQSTDDAEAQPFRFKRWHRLVVGVVTGSVFDLVAEFVSDPKPLFAALGGAAVAAAVYGVTGGEFRPTSETSDKMDSE